MQTEFSTVYSAVIITRGEYAYIRKGDKFHFLEGVKVGDNPGSSPRNDITSVLYDMIGITFTVDWLRYIGATIHTNEYCPCEYCELDENFIVLHYWLDFGNLPDMNLENLGLTKFLLSDMVENKHGNILNADSLAAKRVLDIRNQPM